MKNKAIFKWNNGNLALLCSECSVIIKTGSGFTKKEHKACKGERRLRKQYCENCKNKRMGLFNKRKKQIRVTKRKIRRIDKSILNLDLEKAYGIINENMYDHEKKYLEQRRKLLTNNLKQLEDASNNNN